MIRFSIAIVIALALAPAAQAGRSPACAIKITTTYFGRPAEVLMVTGGRIRHEKLLRGKGVKVNRALNASERKRLRAFMKAFPLSKLKTRYVSKVRGESSTTYDIRCGKQHKQIYQYFKEQKDLTALWRLLHSFAEARRPAPKR